MTSSKIDPSAVVVPSSAVVPAETTPTQDFGVLVPVFQTQIGASLFPVQAVNARDLHAFLGVRSHFRDWIKNRISEYEFVQGVDYVAVGKNLPGGAKNLAVDYTISLGMAKELAMVERTKAGRQVRRYFIECEKQLLIELQREYPIRQRVPLGCTTRPLITSRAQLSFRAVDEVGNAIMALADSRAAWTAPRGLPVGKSKQIGKVYFAELKELAENNLTEARQALVELFLFGWRTPMEIKQPKTEKVSIGGGESVQVLKKDALAHPDVAGDFGVEWSFLDALADAALNGAH